MVLMASPSTRGNICVFEFSSPRQCLSRHHRLPNQWWYCGLNDMQQCGASQKFHESADCSDIYGWALPGQPNLDQRKKAFRQQPNRRTIFLHTEWRLQVVIAIMPIVYPNLCTGRWLKILWGASDTSDTHVVNWCPFWISLFSLATCLDERASNWACKQTRNLWYYIM